MPEAVELKRIGLKEIATAAGVSMSTVSRALGGDERVNQKTRRRIMATAQILQSQGMRIRPQLLTQQPKHSRSLVLVQPSHGNETGDTEISVQVLESIQDICEQAGFSVVTSRLRIDASTSTEAAIRIPSDAQGLIGYRLHDQHAPLFIARARELQLPFVLLNRTDADSTVASCSTDHAMAGRMAINHLLSLGHRRLALLFNSSQIYANQQRLRGIRDVLTERRVDLPTALVRTDLNTVDEITDAAVAMVRHHGATAIITANDRFGMAVLAKAAKEGIRVPQELSVIGFDGTDAGRSSHPSLTSVYTPWKEMSRSATQMLLWMMEDNLLQNVQLTWKPKLIERDSCGPAAG